MCENLVNSQIFCEPRREVCPKRKSISYRPPAATVRCHSTLMIHISHSCYHWRQILEEHGPVNRPPSPLRGRARTITRALLTAMEDMFFEDPDLYLDEICTWLTVEHDIFISTSSLSRTLNSVGLSHKIIQKLASE